VGPPRHSRIFLSVVLLVLSAVCGADAAVTVYFYSPETNINNWNSLKAEFDTYFSGRGPYRFQPFKKMSDFEEFVVGRKDGVLLVSSWHYLKLKDRTPLEPVLVGSAKGQTTQRWMLSAKKRMADVAALKGKRIASAGSRDYTRTILRDMLAKEGSGLAKSLKILEVPKDIDALLSVGFGMAKGAVATENSHRKLQQINPKQYSLLRQLAVSEGTLLPVVAAPMGAGPELKGLLKVLEEMGDRPEGVKCLKMIGLDI